MKPNPALYPRFRTKTNRLTAYAFNCGYKETFDHNGQSVEIWQDGGCSFYHIRAHDFNTGKRLFWDDRKILVEARKRFDEAKRVMVNGQQIAA